MEESENMVIRRKIFRANNRSVYRLNGKEVTEQIIKDRVAALGIQMDNLVQFLPQDRVADFAKMNPQELLTATEKTADDEKLFETHVELIEIGRNVKVLREEIDSHHLRLEEDRTANAQRKAEFERWTEVETYKQELSIMEKKLPWLEYEDARKMYLNAKEEFGTAHKQFEEDFKFLEPMKKARKKAEQNVLARKDAVKSQASETGKVQKKLNKTFEKFTDETENFNALQRDVKTFEKQSAKYANRVAAAKTKQDEIRATMEDAQSDPKAVMVEINHLKKKQISIRGEQSEIIDELEDVMTSKRGKTNLLKKLHHELQQTESVAAQKQEIFLRHNQHLASPIRWVSDQNLKLEQGQQSEFKQRVFLPLILNVNVNVNDSNVANYVEQSIPGRDRGAFIAQNADDQRTLVNRFRSGQEKIAINVVRITHRPYSNVASPSQLQQLGLDGLLIDFVEAPDEIKMYLANNCNMHQIPFALHGSDQLTQILQDKGFSTYFVGSNGYRVLSSRFGKQSNALRVDTVRPARFLNFSIDADKQQQLVRKIKDLEKEITRVDTQVHGLQQKSMDYKKQLDAVQHDISLLNEKMSSYKKLDASLKRAISEENTFKKSLETAKKNEDDAKAKIPIAAGHCLSSMEKLSQLSKDVSNFVYKHQLLMLQEEVARMELRKLKKDLEEHERDYEDRKNHMKGLKNESTRLKNEALKKLEAAKESNDGNMPDEKQKEAFKTLPDSVDELNIEYKRTKAKIDTMSGVDLDMAKEYHVVKKRIERDEQVLGEKETELSDHEKKLTSRFQHWKRSLEAMIKQISTTYSEFFKQLGCAGEVGILDAGEDYAGWGVLILVSFRKEDSLQQLQAHHQSGGERSVATMLYLMAMQQLASCPFRVVDEINQGMDATNEKRVFEQVVNCSTSDQSQYFLITPKLLPNLTYNEHMRVFCVYNGPEMLPSENWNVDEFISRAKRLKAK
eukprot:m.90771 g.90771  ORF g.90771 m.90771 type:complete len:961 (+) comp8855_c0_seq3:395-3277(+)